jgi:hypothetical protein
MKSWCKSRSCIFISQHAEIASDCYKTNVISCEDRQGIDHISLVRDIAEHVGPSADAFPHPNPLQGSLILDIVSKFIYEDYLLVM